MLRFIWFCLVLGWFGFIGRLICVSDIHIVFKILLMIGDLAIGFYTFVLYYNETTED